MASVSVVIPIHNMREWVQQTLHSVVTQTHGLGNNLEIIVIDSGSTDESAEVAESVLGEAGAEFRILRTENRGPSAARNIGWQQARGDWIQFLDGDDLLRPQKIEIQLSAAHHVGFDIAVLYSDWGHLRRGILQWEFDPGMVAPSIGADSVADLLRPGNFLPVGSQLVRKTWLERVSGFDERHWFIEDVDLLLRIAMRGGGFCRVPHPDPLFSYRQHEGSLSRRSQRAFIEGCIRNAGMVEVYWRENGDLSSSRAELLAGIYLQGARYFASCDKKRFEEVVGQIEALVPRFLPSGPRHLRYASRMLGYRRAETFALLYRRLKNLGQAVAQ